MQHNFSGPLYEQVHRLLSRRIRSGEWPNGKPIPGEAHLSREYGVSIGTVRKAMDKLASERIVIRERGRGTFISPQAPNKNVACGQIVDEGGKPLPVSITVTGATTQSAGAEFKRLLFDRPYSGSPRVVVVQRIWRTGGRVIGHETLTLSEARFPNLASGLPDTAETYFDHYAAAFGISIQDVRWELRSPNLASLKGALPIGDSTATVIAIRRTAFDATATAVELCDLALTLQSETFHVALPTSIHD